VIRQAEVSGGIGATGRTFIEIVSVNNVPGSKRRRSYQRNLAKARKAIISGDLQPSVRPVALFCGAGTKTAQAILAELVNDGVLMRDTRGRAVLRA